MTNKELADLVRIFAKAYGEESEDAVDLDGTLAGIEPKVKHESLAPLLEDFCIYIEQTDTYHDIEGLGHKVGH